MPVHPEIQKILAFIPPYDASVRVDPNEHRNMFNAPSIPEAERAAVHHIEERVIQLAHRDITIRIYTPHEAETYPILMYYHGGAFFAGNLESHDEVARPLCASSGYKVIAIDYRLAPEHPFPAGLNDCYDVTKWVTQHADELQWDGEHLAVSGDSSGGNFAAVITQLARERQEFTITKQVLLYPSVDVTFDAAKYPSVSENGTGYFVEAAQLPELNHFYLQTVDSLMNPLVSPIYASTFTDLPEALVVVAEFDPMRDEGIAYAKKLAAADVAVTTKVYEGVTHGFLGKWTHLPEYAGVYDDIGAFLKRAVTV